MYCTRAIKQTALKNSPENLSSRKISAGGPKTRFRTVDVKNVDVARIAELKRIVRGRLLMISVAATPSSADIRIAAEPPYNSIVRKTNVSRSEERRVGKECRS